MGLTRFILLTLLSFILLGCGDTPSPAQQKQEATESKVADGATDSVAQKDTEKTKPQACRLVMGWDPWEPYHYQNLNNQVVGLDVELITTVINNAGCEVSYYRQGWAKLLKMLKEGQVDVLAGATRTPKREKFAYFTDGYREEEFWLFVEASDLEDYKDKSFTDLMDDKLRIGVIQGYLYDDVVTEYQDNIKYQGLFMDSSMSEINVSLLLDGEIDGFIEDKYVGASILRRKNLSQKIVAHPQRFTRREVHMMISKSSVGEELFKRINQSLQELKQSGQLDEIRQRYLN